jgi:hypothetical protein
MHFVQFKVLSGHLDAVPGPFRTRCCRSRTCCYRAMKIEGRFESYRPRHENRGLLRAGQDLDEVGHPAYLLPTPRQYLSSATHYLT